MLWTVVIISLTIQVAKTVWPNHCLYVHQSIDCSSRQLTIIPNDLPSEFNVGSSTTFISLNLANNKLEELPTSFLSENLPHLQSLDLSNNKIREIAHIQSVVLSKELLYLKLTSNPIRNLGFNTDTVLYSQSISHLDISHCDINSITNPVTFMYLLNLTDLNLSGNPLFVVDHFVSSTLRHVDLSCCLLGFHDKGIREEAFINLQNLKFLNLSMNAHLTRLPLSKPLSSSLLHLEASYCALEKLDLRSFPNLQQAILKGNVIKTLYNDMLSNNMYLKSLDISENSVHHIEKDAFMGGNSLTNLDLSLNLLSDLNWDTFLKTPHLTRLNISRNLFSYLDEIPIPSLISFDASKCDILKFNPMFLAKTQDLMYLNLSYNAIEKLPRRLFSRKLTSLDLSFCRLSDIPDDTFHGLSSLMSLNLMGNRLTSPIKEHSFNYMMNLKEINLLNNPWHCDCNDSDFGKMWKYISSPPPKTKYFKTLICHSPKQYNGMTWEKSCFESFTSSEKIPKNGAWFSFIVPCLTLCCLLAIMIVIRQAYTAHGLEIQQREIANQRLNSSQSREFLPRVASHNFDDDLERGIQLSVNESTQRSPIQELSKLPSYEEALLLPKVGEREDLQNILKKYEESDRFAGSVIEETQSPHSQCNQSDEDYINHPSTSAV